MAEELEAPELYSKLLRQGRFARVGRNKEDSPLMGALDAATTIGSGMAAQVPAGLEGIVATTGALRRGSSLRDATQAGAAAVNQGLERYTRAPATETGQRYAGNVSDVMEKVEDIASRTPGWETLTTASPGAAASVLAGANFLKAPKAATITKALRKAKQPKAVFSVFQDVTDPAVAKEMAMHGAHLKVDPTTGKYVGAPDWVDSPQALGTMRNNALNEVRGGIFNADWYDRQRALATALADEPERQSLFARGTANYSPQSMPKVELPAFTRQHNEKMLTGKTVQPRTVPQSKNMNQAYVLDPDTKDVAWIDPDAIKLGEKTGPYAEAKDPTVPAESLFKAPSDVWHGRVMGYPGKDGKPFSRGFKPSETGFLTGENIRLTEAAKAEGLPVGDVKGAQAAAWGTTRLADARADDAARFAKEQKQRERYEADPAKWRKQNPGKAAPPQPSPMASDADLRAYASEGLDTALPRQTAHITSEAVTGADTGHLTGMSDPVKASYTADILRATGRDPVIEGLGLFSEKPIETQGIYKNNAGDVERNPAFVDPVLVSNVGNSNTRGGIRTPEIEREALDIAAHTGAYMRGQEAGAWNRFLPQEMSPQVGAMNSARASNLSPQEINQLIDAGLSPIDIGRGTHHITRFGEEGPVVGTQRDVQQIVPRAERGTMETGYREGIGKKETEGTGVATDRLVQAYENSKIKNLTQRLGAGSKLEATARAYAEIQRAAAKANNLPLREDLLRALDILGKGGMDALVAHVKKFGSQGLPVALLGALGLQGLQGLQDEEPLQ